MSTLFIGGMIDFGSTIQIIKIRKENKYEKKYYYKNISFHYDDNGNT